jgi:hypothetical protein
MCACLSSKAAAGEILISEASVKSGDLDGCSKHFKFVAHNSKS